MGKHLVARPCLAIALARDRRAVTAVEYGLIVALIGLVIAVALKNLGVSLLVPLNTISTTLAGGGR